MAANQSSPGVVVQERDLTTVSTVSTANIGVMAAPFELGPVEEIVEVSSERQLAEQFGEPNDYNYEYWFTAAQYLAYGGTLKTVRVASSNLKNAVDTGSAPLIKNLQDYETTFETANNTFTWVARTAGAKGNSIGVFVTDAGADQIAVIPAPGSGNDPEFVADAAVSASSGASGKVFKYSILLTVESVVGDFTPGATTTISISGSNETVNVLSYDPTNLKLEIGLPGGGVTGIIAAGQTITQGTNTCDIATNGIERRLYIASDKGTVAFAASDSIQDTNSTAFSITSVRNEYAEREYLPGVKWINVLHVLVDLNLAPEPASWPNSSNDQRNAAATFNALLKPGSKAPFHFFLNMLGKMRSKKKDKYEELLIKLVEQVIQKLKTETLEADY